jgi:hypothetical protein
MPPKKPAAKKSTPKVSKTKIAKKEVVTTAETTKKEETKKAPAPKKKTAAVACELCDLSLVEWPFCGETGEPHQHKSA